MKNECVAFDLGLILTFFDTSNSVNDLCIEITWLRASAKYAGMSMALLMPAMKAASVLNSLTLIMCVVLLAVALVVVVGVGTSILSPLVPMACLCAFPFSLPVVVAGLAVADDAPLR